MTRPTSRIPMLPSRSRPARRWLAALAACGFAAATFAVAADEPSTSLHGYGFKVFKVDSSLYPYVQIYFRTLDQEKHPLVNLNELNVGLMVKGRSYDLAKRQYIVESIKNRREATRSVLVLDASASMQNGPFRAALEAAARYIDSKRSQDQIAILAIRDTAEGYELVSNFERDPGTLGRRLLEVRCDGKRTRLYDSVAAAMQLLGTATQVGSTATAEPIASGAVVVLSDGLDEGSALSREELNARITGLPIPIPIYSLAYSKVSQSAFKNLESLSKNSFGVYYEVGQAFERMQRVVEDVQNIIQNDYVVTFRSYVDIDGEEHAVKVGLEYPSRSGNVTYESVKFEAIEPPPVPTLEARRAALGQQIRTLDDGNPYLVPSAGVVPPAPGNAS